MIPRPILRIYAFNSIMNSVVDKQVSIFCIEKDVNAFILYSGNIKEMVVLWKFIDLKWVPYRIFK